MTRALSFVGYIKTLLLLRTHHTSPSIDEFEKKREKERERERDFTSIGIILESNRDFLLSLCLRIPTRIRAVKYYTGMIFRFS